MNNWWLNRRKRKAERDIISACAKPRLRSRWMPTKKALPELQLAQILEAPQPGLRFFNVFNQFQEKPVNDNESAFSSGWCFIQKLKKKGFSKLGNGAHSVVLAKGISDRVIKVGHSGDNWMNYILWGRKMGYEGTLVPKVYSYKWFEPKKEGFEDFRGHGFYVAVVERMQRCAKHQSQTDADPVLVNLMHNAVCGNPHAIKAMDAIHPRAGQFALDLKQAANDNGWGFDIHNGNFMVRDDGSFVATDPVNDHCDPCKQRIRSAA